MTSLYQSAVRSVNSSLSTMIELIRSFIPEKLMKTKCGQFFPEPDVLCKGYLNGCSVSVFHGYSTAR